MSVASARHTTSRAPLRLEGPRVCLRPFEASDLTSQYLGWLNDPEVTRYLEVGKQPVTRKAAAAYLARFEGSDTDQLWTIIDRASGRRIGTVTLNRIDHHLGTADTGLMIGERSWWGRGYATEAWSLLLGHAFKTLRLRRIIAGAVIGHHASIRTLEKLGFQCEGTSHREGPGFSWDIQWLSVRPEDVQPPAWS